MTPAKSCNLYEQISGASFTASGIRPGGILLTYRGLECAALYPGTRILDIGCGNGVTIRHLAQEHGMQVVGLDLSAKLVAQARNKDAALPLVLGNGERLPFADESFDAVILECTLSLIEDSGRALRECRRILNSGGKIILTDVYVRNPARIEPLRDLPVHSCLRGAPSKSWLLNVFAETGFEALLFEDHSDLLKRFAAEIIWEYGSLDQFWADALGPCVNHEEVRRAVNEARPGYFLLVGRKNHQSAA